MRSAARPSFSFSAAHRLVTRGRFLFEVGQFLLEPLEAILRGVVRLDLQRFPLDLELHDAPVDLVELFRLGIDLHAQPRCGFVNEIDRLVRQEAVGDVAVRQCRGCDQRRIRNPHLVVLLVFLLQPAQDRDRVLDRRLIDEDRLETAGERGILFDMLAVLVERRRTDAVQFAARQRRLQEVRRVHRAIGLARADQRVHLVDEQDDAAGGRLNLGQHGLQPLLELAAIFRAGNERAHVERHQLLVLETFRNVAIDDAQRQPLGDRRLADAGLADQHRIVLGAPGKHLDRAADFVVAADDRVELARARIGRQVARIFLQRVIGLLGRSRIGRPALAHVVDDLVQRDGGHAGLGEDVGGLRRLFHRHRRQKTLDGDEANRPPSWRAPRPW